MISSEILARFDPVLIQLIKKRPATDEALLKINGIGPKKLVQDGSDFLEVFGKNK